MLRAIPIDPLKFNKNYTNLNNENVLLVSSSEAGWRAIAEDVVVLKKHLISVFNETFCTQLIVTTQVSGMWKRFIEILILISSISGTNGDRKELYGSAFKAYQAVDSVCAGQLRKYLYLPKICIE